MSNNLLKKIALPIGIIAMGILIMFALTKLRSQPERSAPSTAGVLINSETAKLADWQITVSATATVRPEEEISIIPQVSGAIKSMSPNFVEGGFFKKGQVLFKIDDTDYMLALRGAQATKTQSDVELETIKSRAGIARQEWEIMSGAPTGGLKNNNAATINGEGSVTPNPLVLYEPQMKNAQAANQSASSKVELARLNLQRTTIRAPFDCRVRTKNIDVGQYVKSGAPIASIAGTGSAEVVIPLQREELNAFDIPGFGSAKTGSVASITLPGSETIWTGRVVRSTGEMDAKSRMIKVVVKVVDPYGLKSGKPPLMNGAFANVTIKGRVLENVIAISRSALRDEGTVWTMNKEGKLEIKHVDIVRFEGDKAIVSSGLVDGDIIVLTKLSGAAPGMKLRVLSAIKNNEALEEEPSLSDEKGSVTPEGESK